MSSHAASSRTAIQVAYADADFRINTASTALIPDWFT
ncbi:hypothetical protein ABH945_003642 [Paraburkholderia sp. GAS333]